MQNCLYDYFHKEFGKDLDAPNFETDEGDEDLDSFQRKLDEKLLGKILQTMILCVLNFIYKDVVLLIHLVQ